MAEESWSLRWPEKTTDFRRPHPDAASLIAGVSCNITARSLPTSPPGRPASATCGSQTATWPVIRQNIHDPDDACQADKASDPASPERLKA